MCSLFFKLVYDVSLGPRELSRYCVSVSLAVAKQLSRLWEGCADVYHDPPFKIIYYAVLQAKQSSWILCRYTLLIVVGSDTHSTAPCEAPQVCLTSTLMKRRCLAEEGWMLPMTLKTWSQLLQSQQTRWITQRMVEQPETVLQLKHC